MPRLEHFCTRCKHPTLGCDALAKGENQADTSFDMCCSSLDDAFGGILKPAHFDLALHRSTFLDLILGLVNRRLDSIEHCSWRLIPQGLTFEASLSSLGFCVSFEVKYRLACVFLSIVLFFFDSAPFYTMATLTFVLVVWHKSRSFPRHISFFSLPLHSYSSLKPQHTRPVSDQPVSDYIIPHTLPLQKTLHSYLLYHHHHGKHRFRHSHVQARQLLFVHCRLRLRQFPEGERPSRGADSAM